MKNLFLLVAVLCFVGRAWTQSQPESLPAVPWHLTARPWQPVNAPRRELLDHVDAILHAVATLQYHDAGSPDDPRNGAIIDPYNHEEWQYSTAFFTFAAATLLSQERAPDLIGPAAQGMDRATLEVAIGTVPQMHGEFVVAPLMKAWRLFQTMHAAGRYPDALTDPRLETWRSRLKTDRRKFMNYTVLQNWRTYASKGDWLRQQDGLITDGVAWIESNWLTAAGGNQRARFYRDVDQYGISPHFLAYHDDTGDPETFAYNAGAAGNLLDMLESGYDGPSATDMRRTVEYGLRSDLLYMGASGEAPAGGRSGNHVWNDIVCADAFELMARVNWRDGDAALAGQFRHAAQLALKSAWRFQQEKGWMSVTKNLFHPSLKNHYAIYSALTNYNGYAALHACEAWCNRQEACPEAPTPGEIGGYCVTLDPSYANTFLNAGGMQVQICTRGTEDAAADAVDWHTLGISRFSRAGWDSRLGPADGFAHVHDRVGINFAPTFREGDRWVDVCTEPDRFVGEFTPAFVHPLLVRGVLAIAPKPGKTGPSFAMNITLTPDGALVDTARTAGTEDFGVVWPLLEYDGRNVLVKNVGAHTASTAYPRTGEEEIIAFAVAAKLTGGATLSNDAIDLPPEGGSAAWENEDGGPGGAAVIGFRYALGTAARTARLMVNGEARDVTFDSTGAWNDWHQIDLPVTLRAGKVNDIRLVSTGQGAAHVSELRVYPSGGDAAEPDQQNFLALKDSHRLDASGGVVRGGYGDLRPVRVTDEGGAAVGTFVYPRSAGDPAAEAVRASFRRDGADFSSLLGRVKGNLYMGRASAGGEGSGIDLDGDGKDDVVFSKPCRFILQLVGGRVSAVEADAEVTANLGGRRIDLHPYTPVRISEVR